MVFLREIESLSERLAHATANARAAIYYAGAAEEEAKKGNLREVERLSTEAARLIRDVLKLEFDRGPLLELAGDLYRKAGDLRMASVCYRDAFELHRGDQDLARKLVETEAEADYDPDDSFYTRPYSYHMLYARNGIAYGLEDRDILVEKAISEVKSYLASNEDDADALIDLGSLLKETGDINGSIGCFERVLEVNPEINRVKRLLMWAYRDRGRDDEARGLLEEGQDVLDGFHPRVYDPDVSRAWEYADLGDFAKAAIHMEKALEIDPDDEVNRRKLEYYYAATNQYEEAEKCRTKNKVS